MREATVCHLLRENGHGKELLLGQRSGLFCPDIWNGPGGKMKSGESIITCIRREVSEEIGVEVGASETEHVATADFFHKQDGGGHKLCWRVHFINTTSWIGEPRLIEEFRQLEWFPIHNLPFEKMMVDRRVWLHLALDNVPGKLLQVCVFYGDAECKTIERVVIQFADKPSKPKLKKH